MENTSNESKRRLVEQINICLGSGDYSRALDVLRGSGAEFPNDPQLSELEKLARDGIQGKAEADRLITESQELFAQRRSSEAIQLLRKAYEMDQRNSLARAILANALVEHANFIVETDWLEAEKLTNEALKLNPAHPTAKTIRSLIVEQKRTSPVEYWVSQARKLQSSGDLFGALGWVAEGLAVHPEDPKLLQIQDAIQRDQDARRRQARRGDVDELRRLQREIDGAADVAAKQALAERIQAVAAKYWTDGEILSIANALLLRLGLVAQEGSNASPRGKSATVILHVPRPSAAKPAPADTIQIPPSRVLPTEVQPAQTQPNQIHPRHALPSQPALSPVPQEEVPAAIGQAGQIHPGKVPASNIPLGIPLRGNLRTASVKPPTLPAQAVTVPAAKHSAPAGKVRSASPSQANAKRAKSSKSTGLILGSAAAIILFAAIFFFARKHHFPPIAKTPAVPAVSAPATSAPTVSAPSVSAPADSAPAKTTSETSPADLRASSDASSEKGTLDDQPQAESGHNVGKINQGTLIVVAGQDGARVFVNGKLQPQLTRAGQLRLPNLEFKEYVVQVSKSGFQDPPPQKIRVRDGQEARLVFNLQPQPSVSSPRLASVTIQGGVPGTAVLVDQTVVGIVQNDGTLSVSTVNPGDHSIELRKERFQPRQFKKHFVAGGTISLAAADAALEAAPGELKITFAPADAKVAIVKGDLLKMVSSGVPLDLAAGTYTLTARTAERFTRSSTIEVIAGQSKTLDLSLAPSGMSKWDDPGGWKQERDSFTRKGGDFVLYGVVPASGTFVFSATLNKGHLLQWVLNFTDPKNYILFQMDDNNFYRTVIRNGEKRDEIKVPDKGNKKGFRTIQIRVGATEIVHQIRHGDSWTVLDRWMQFGANLGAGKFGFYIPGNDQVALAGFAHYADMNIR